MIPAGLAFAAYLACPDLAVDLDILMRCGRVQEIAAADGIDTPAGWFLVAARSYGIDGEGDDVGKLGRLACALVAASLGEGSPS